MDKRQRKYQLLIGPTYRLNPATNLLSIVDADVLVIEPPFTVEFDIKRQNIQSTNNGTFRIFNLAETKRRKCARDDHQYALAINVEFKAGYGTILPTIFKGTISHGWSVREGVNFVTSIEAFDGGSAMLNGVTNKTFAAGTPNNQIIQSVVGDLPGITLGAIGNYPGTLPRGNSFSGNPADIANTLTNGGFFIDSQKAYALGDNECLRGDLLVLSSDAGLLGTPVRANQMLHIDVLFEPRIQMCQLILLQSLTAQNYDGQYKVVSISHRGMISDAVSGDAVTSLGMWQGPSGGSALTVVN